MRADLKTVYFLARQDNLGSLATSCIKCALSESDFLPRDNQTANVSMVVESRIDFVQPSSKE